MKENENEMTLFEDYLHSVKSIRIRSFSGPYFPAFGQNMEIYGVNLRIQPKCRKWEPGNLQIFSEYFRT